MGMGGREKEKRDTGAGADGGGEDKKGRRAEGRRSSSCVSPLRVLAERFRARHGSHPCHDNGSKRRSHWLIPSLHSPREPDTFEGGPRGRRPPPHCPLFSSLPSHILPLRLFPSTPALWFLSSSNCLKNLASGLVPPPPSRPIPLLPSPRPNPPLPLCPATTTRHHCAHALHNLRLNLGAYFYAALQAYKSLRPAHIPPSRPFHS
jgi:hypothetical protein